MALKLADDELKMPVNESHHPSLLSSAIQPLLGLDITLSPTHNPAVPTLHTTEMNKPARWRKSKNRPEAKGSARLNVQIQRGFREE
jgi:hypothetical protein